MEALIQGFQAVLGNTYIVTAALVGFITVCLRLLISLLDFHDRHVVHKKYERLRKLRELTAEGTSLADYLDRSIQGEAFRIASGISASPEKIKFLMKLSTMGRWDHSQLRSISGYVRLDPDSVEPSICIGRFNFFDAMFCLFGSAYFAFAGLFFLFWSGIYLPTPFGWLAGAGLCLVFSVCALGMFKGYLNYLIAKRAKEYLDLSRDDRDESSTPVRPMSAAA